RLTDRHKTIPYFKRVLVSSDTWGRSMLDEGGTKWGGTCIEIDGETWKVKFSDDVTLRRQEP
ncbi:hypothetical protein, partial [Burkholderia multivorans]|uniref:hypothetical protein n=1 Tax=Burkholderia multivorans TaxID=87883 RepID=UPI002870449D